jgi:hypothetical protein
LLNGRYNGTIYDAELLLGKMHTDRAWKPSTIKQVRKRWEEKESFLFAAKMEEFSGILSFDEEMNGNIIELVESEAKNHRRYKNYFSSVKEIITQLTPEISKELEKDEVWGKLGNPRPLTLKAFSDDERKKIDSLRLKRVRQSAEEIKAPKRPRSQ